MVIFDDKKEGNNVIARLETFTVPVIIVVATFYISVVIIAVRVHFLSYLRRLNILVYFQIITIKLCYKLARLIDAHNRSIVQ